MYLVCVVGLRGANVLHRCYTGNTSEFTTLCPPDHVIRIRSAEVGFMPDWNDVKNGKPCHLTESTCAPWWTEDTCSEGQRYAISDFVNEQCDFNGNIARVVVKVGYSCIKGKWNSLLLDGCCIWTVLICCCTYNYNCKHVRFFIKVVQYLVSRNRTEIITLSNLSLHFRDDWTTLILSCKSVLTLLNYAI